MSEICEGCEDVFESGELVVFEGALLCEDCCEEFEDEDRIVSNDDEEFMKRMGGRENLILVNVNYPSVRFDIWCKDGEVWRTTYEGDKVVKESRLNVFDWKNGVLYGLDNGGLKIDDGGVED